MCLLVLAKEGSKMGNKSINNAWNRNEDGSGYAFIKNGVIQTKKYLDLKEFKSSYNADFKKYGHSSKFLIHFRYATHGVNDLTNVHPFKINDGLVFGHNGVINDVRDDAKLSDTRVFNVDILQRLNTNFINDEAILKLMSIFIGGSKLVFLNSNNEFKIVNESAGHWSKKCKIWYSNDSYKKPEYMYGGYRGNYQGGITYYTDKNTGCSPATKKLLADDSFLKCDVCDTQTDTTFKTEENYQLCTMCYAGENTFKF